MRGKLRQAVSMRGVVYRLEDTISAKDKVRIMDADEVGGCEGLAT